MYKKWRIFLFFTRDWEKNNKNHFHSVEIGNDVVIYINIKQVFFDSLIKSTMYLLIFRQNSMIFEGIPNSLTKSCFTGELKLGESLIEGVAIHRCTGYNFRLVPKILKLYNSDFILHRVFIRYDKTDVEVKHSEMTELKITFLSLIFWLAYSLLDWLNFIHYFKNYFFRNSRTKWKVKSHRQKSFPNCVVWVGYVGCVDSMWQIIAFVSEIAWFYKILAWVGMV